MSTDTSRRLLLALAAAALLVAAACSRSPAPPQAADAAARRAAMRALPSPPAQVPDVTFTDFEARLAAAGPSGEIRLEPGTHVLTPATDADTACALCPGPEWQQARPAFTRGARLSGKGLRIVGAGADRTVIRTGAGVGLLFDGCEDCVLQGVTVTGGERDRGDQVADAAVVVRESSVEIRDCVLMDNIGAEFMVRATYVGIGGVLVREGGVATVDACRILRNSWDGVTAVRGGRVTVRNTVVDGVDRARGEVVGGGRGPGIRVALGGQATLEGVLVTRHDGGIAAYGAASVVLRDVLLEDLPSWGVMVRGDADGSPSLDIEGLAVHRTAGTGLAVMGAAPDPSRYRLREVRLSFTARQPSDGPGPAARVPGKVDASDVLAWGTGSGAAEGDVGSAEFEARSAGLAGRLAGVPATAGTAFVGSLRGAR